MSKLEYCCKCSGETGRAGKGDDSIYVDDEGPFCEACAAQTTNASCLHENFNAQVKVNRLVDSGRFTADIKINCDVCGEPFRFLGLPPGVDLNGATVSVDGTEARMAIGPTKSIANFLDGYCPVGFTVRRLE